MSQASKQTKKGSLTAVFLQKAALDPEGALAYMFLQAFGITLTALMKVAETIMTNRDVKMVMMAFTAGVQIRAHVTFVGREFASVRTLYPDLVIEGKRGVKDIYNFGAIHALGHLLGHVTGSSLGAKMLGKAGSCITGENTSESEAGKINKEIAASWLPSDKTACLAWINAKKASASGFLDPAVESILTKSQAFGKVLGAAPPAAPAAGAAGDDEDPEEVD